MQVHIETLKTISGDLWSRATVEITIKGDRREVVCYESGGANHRHLVIYGLAVRFSSGEKVWPGSATYWFESGNVNNLRPNIDKRGYFTLVGFISDYEGKSVRSTHNAVV